MITLLTDFGLTDHFAGVMKGVIAGIAPGVPVVDITHEVAPFEVLSGAFLLEQAWRYFPVGTVHVAVVDPGVGSARRALLVEFAGHRFVGPDNGIFGFVLREEGVRVRSIENEGYFLRPVSRTFHGRDVFAPVAAHLSLGVEVEEFGPGVEDAWRGAAWEPVRMAGGAWAGSVLHVDRFGNLVTNFAEKRFGGLRPFEMVAGAERVERLAANYTNCVPEELCLIEGSSGYYEISLALGSAAARTGLKAGSPLELKESDA